MYSSFQEVEVQTDATRDFVKRVNGRFLKGPIPMRDICTAAALPGRALALFLAIHHRVALTRDVTVTLPRGLLQQLGVNKDSKSRGLGALERAGLIRVARSRGTAARITLTV